MLLGSFTAAAEPTPLFTVTNNIVSDGSYLYCNQLTKGYVTDRAQTIHNPDGNSYKFGPTSASGGWPFLDAAAKLPASGGYDAVVLVISADEKSQSKYPLRLGIKGQNTQKLTLVSIGEDGTTSVMENQKGMSFAAGTVNYVILKVEDSTTTIDSSSYIHLWSDYRASNYNAVYYLDSIGYVNNVTAFIESVKEASKPALSMNIDPQKDYANISWGQNKPVNAANYRVTVYNGSDTEIGTYETVNTRISVFLERNTEYKAKVEALDQNGTVVGASAKLSFSTTDYAPLYTVTNSMNSMGSAFQWISNKTKNATAHSVQPSQWHPDGKYVSFDLNGESAIEVWLYTGFDGINTKDAAGVVYMVEGGSNITTPEGGAPLDFLWSSNPFKNKMKCWHMVSIDKNTGERTFYEDMDNLGMRMTVRPDTVNFIIIELKDNVDISTTGTEAHFWNDKTKVGYTGTVYVDDYGVTDNVQSLIAELMAPNFDGFAESTGDVIVDVDALTSLADVYYTAADSVTGVEDYYINLYKADDAMNYALVSEQKATVSPTTLNIDPASSYAVQVIGKDSAGNSVAVSNVKVFSSAATDVDILVEGGTAEAKVSWSVVERVGYLDKFDVCWYKKDGETLTEVGTHTVEGAAEYTVKGLFPEDTYQIEVYAYNPDGTRNEHPAKAFVTMKNAFTIELLPDNTEITANWTVSDELVTLDKFKVSIYEIDKDENRTLVESKTITEKTASFKGLTPLQKYGVELTALDSDGNALTYDFFNTVTTTTDLTLSYTSDLEWVELSWVPDSALSGIKKYRVDWYTVDSDNVLTLENSTETEETTLKIEALPQGTKFAAQVFALDKDGEELAISNRPYIFTKAPVHYTVTNDFTGIYDVYWKSYGVTATIKDEISLWHPDGTFYKFGTNGKGSYSQLMVNTNFKSKGVSADAEAIVFMLRVDEKSPTGYPIWVKLAGAEAKDCKITVVSVETASGEITVSNWVGGRSGSSDKTFSPGTANYIVIEPPEGTDFSNISRVNFEAPSLETDYLGAIMYIDDIGYTTDAMGLLTSLSGKSEYEFGPLTEEDKISVTVKDMGASWADFDWTPVTGAASYKLNVYKKNTSGYYLLSDSVSTAENARKYTMFSAKTEYTVQVLAMDEQGGVITASKLTTFTTEESDIPAYRLGVVEYNAGYMPDYVIHFTDGEIIVKWPTIEGVYYYLAVLYENVGGTLTYSDYRTSEKEGSASFPDLDTSKEYYVQVLLFDQSDSIIFAYEPMKAVSMKRPTKIIKTLVESPANDTVQDFLEEQTTQDFFDEQTDQDFSEEQDFLEEQTTQRRKKKMIRKVVTHNDGYDYTWIIIVCIIAGVVVAAGVTLLIILRAKRKKKAKIE